jgi:hypothetical protein
MDSSFLETQTSWFLQRALNFFVKPILYIYFRYQVTLGSPNLLGNPSRWYPRHPVVACDAAAMPLRHKGMHGHPRSAAPQPTPAPSTQHSMHAHTHLMPGQVAGRACSPLLPHANRSKHAWCCTPGGCSPRCAPAGC